MQSVKVISEKARLKKFVFGDQTAVKMCTLKETFSIWIFISTKVISSVSSLVCLLAYWRDFSQIWYKARGQRI